MPSRGVRVLRLLSLARSYQEFYEAMSRRRRRLTGVDVTKETYRRTERMRLR
jgi:hypothetical protein